jgi:hypothetical protein
VGENPGEMTTFINNKMDILASGLGGRENVRSSKNEGNFQERWTGRNGYVANV